MSRCGRTECYIEGTHLHWASTGDPMPPLVDEKRLGELKFLYDGYAAEGCSPEEMFKFPVREILHSLSLALAVVREVQTCIDGQCKPWPCIAIKEALAPFSQAYEYCHGCRYESRTHSTNCQYSRHSDAGTQGEKEKS